MALSTLSSCACAWWVVFLTLASICDLDLVQGGQRNKQKDEALTLLEKSHEYRLFQVLFEKYDHTVRPRHNSSETVEVLIRFSLQQIYDLDEKRQTLTISGWLTAEWHDEFLLWNPDEFGGVSSVVVSPLKMWTPQLAIGNSADRMFHPWRHFWVTVRSNGTCRWQPGGNFAFTCALDMNLYPFDEQVCTMEIETWYYTSDKVNINNTMDKFGMETYLPHGEWAVLNTAVTNKNVVYKYYSAEKFPEVYFSIRLRRKYTFYFMYILLPCIMLSFVLLMVFLLPAESGEKVSLGVSILVSFSLFLIIVAEQVPHSSDAVPVIAIYLMYFMMTTALSVMMSTMILKLHFHGLNNEPPHWLRVLVFDLMAPLLCLSSANKWSRNHRKCRFDDPPPEAEDLLPEEEELETQEGVGTSCPNSIEMLASTSTPNGSKIKPDTLSLTGSTSLARIMAAAAADSAVAAAAAAGPSARPRCRIPRQHHIELEWQRVSEVLDRFFFWIFLIFIMIPLVSLAGFIRIFK